MTAKEKIREIVINRCWGGFGISNLALYELVKMKSPLVKSFSLKHYHGGDGKNLRQDWEAEARRIVSDCTEELPDGYCGHRMYALLLRNGRLFSLRDNYAERTMLRSHPDLVKVVRRLGEKAYGPHAELKIVAIPSDVEWKIDDYDGMEKICEEHREW